LEQPGLIFGKVFANQYEFYGAGTISFRKRGKIVFFAARIINSKGEKQSLIVTKSLNHFSEKK
jgi:hypothetical protein